MILQNEYLLTIDEKNSVLYHYCSTIDRFLELLAKHSPSINIFENHFQFDNQQFMYSIKQGKVKDKNQILFLLTVQYDSQDDTTIVFEKFTKSLRTFFHEFFKDIQTFRDDIAFHYSGMAYDLIHNVENLMRKFITYTMITSVGTKWIDECSPHDITIALGHSKRSSNVDELHKLDFIDLGTFLFKSYTNHQVEKLYDTINNFNESSNIQELKIFLPASNWKKYFEGKIDCNADYLKVRWEELYVLRCSIAHNSGFDAAQFNRVTQLVTEVTEKIEGAFSRIESVENIIPEQDNSMIELTESQISVFIMEWQKLDIELRKLVSSYIDEGEIYSVNYMLIIKEETLLDAEKITIIEDIKAFYEQIKNETQTVSSTDLITKNEQIQQINNYFLDF